LLLVDILTRALRALGRRQATAVILVGLVSFGACGALGWTYGWPVPWHHDEFSYLLAADTYAHGRLTNPAHPMWAHLESFHIIQQPTYMSKYLPGQGLFLALGQLAGHPALGVWLSLALACAATCWMLQAWTSRTWALLGGLLAAVHPSMLVCWGYTYWGGAVPMLGGALVFGALRRLLDRPPVVRVPSAPSSRQDLAGRGGAVRPASGSRGGRRCPPASAGRGPRRQDSGREGTRGDAPTWKRRFCLALVLGLGLTLLGLTRPYEGLLAAVPAALLLGGWLVSRQRPTLSVCVVQVVVPLAVVLAGAASFLAYANYRVTGDPWCLPYRLHESTYGVAPLFIFCQPQPVPEFRHPVMRDFATGYCLGAYAAHHPWRQLCARAWEKCETLYTFFLPTVLGLPLLFLLLLLRDRWLGFALLTCATVLVGSFLVPGYHPHYSGPIVSLVFFFVVAGLRKLHAFGDRWSWLRFATPALLIVFVAGGAHTVSQHMHNMNNPLVPKPLLEDRLCSLGGEHLVMVRYGNSHSVHGDWVYNRADIDASQVVWARDMGSAKNQELLDYFHGRRAWLLNVEEGSNVQNITLQPYRGSP